MATEDAIDGGTVGAGSAAKTASRERSPRRGLATRLPQRTLPLEHVKRPTFEAGFVSLDGAKVDMKMKRFVTLRGVQRTLCLAFGKPFPLYTVACVCVGYDVFTAEDDVPFQCAEDRSVILVNFVLRIESGLPFGWRGTAAPAPSQQWDFAPETRNLRQTAIKASFATLDGTTVQINTRRWVTLQGAQQMLCRAFGKPFPGTVAFLVVGDKMYAEGDDRPFKDVMEDSLITVCFTRCTNGIDAPLRMS